jgi:hypothetical protein
MRDQPTLKARRFLCCVVKQQKCEFKIWPFFLCSLPSSSEEAAPRVKQVRLGAVVRQLCIALD